jgi:dihydrofolate synthase/folylpolyglutamate synthase
MKFSTVSAWLDWISRIHFQEIELGLERVKRVAARLSVLSPDCPVIMVGGTNGKGSTVAALEAVYMTAGYKVGSFTSPFLFKMNEEIKINAIPVSDNELIQAFAKIEEIREDISLTPFEFHTLAALLIFRTHPLQVWILEVGLGGRLDAVNILNADVSVITSIDIDHADLLGHTKDAIGFEKAGIARANKPLVSGDSNPPISIQNYAQAIHAEYFCQNQDFFYLEFLESDESWNWQYQDIIYEKLPYNNLKIQNLSTACMAMTLLQNVLPIDVTHIRQAFSHLQLPGRVQVIVRNSITHIYDVSHNPAAISYLAQRLTARSKGKNKNIAVFSMLADKDILQSILAIAPQIDTWYIAPIKAKRAASLEQLQKVFEQANIKNSHFFSSLPEAYQQALEKSEAHDQLIIFGSFHTVAEAK